MRRRRNALVCLLTACLLGAMAPTEAMAQEFSAESDLQGIQQSTAGGTTDEKPPGESETDKPEDDGKSDDKTPVKDEDKDSQDKGDQSTSDKNPGKKPDKDNVKDQPKEDNKDKDNKDSNNKKDQDKEGQTPDEAGGQEEGETPDDEEIAVDPEDPGKYRLTGRGTGDFSSSEIQTQAYSHQSKYSDCIIQKGIDVSYHNGTINWKKVKAAGIDFAIIRVAYRGYENGQLKTDTQAFKNMKDASAAGIPIGVYIFSQAITAEEAREEADYITDKISGYDIELPVVLDFEYVAKGVGRLYKAKLNKSEATEVCTTFCDRVKARGYTPMVYANKTMYEQMTYAADFSQEYPIWIARYNNYTGYDGEYEYWQYSSKGKVDGIKTKKSYVDLNYRYCNSLRITKTTKSSISMKWKAQKGAGSYDIYRKASGDSKYTLRQEKVEGTTFRDGSLDAGAYYSYKVYPHGSKTCIGFNTGVTRFMSTSLSGKGTAFDEVLLTWPKVSGATSYYIERYNSLEKAYSTIKTASGRSDSYTDGSRDASTKYKYRIRPYKVVFNGRSFGDYSKVISAKTKGKVAATTKSRKLKLLKSASKSSGSLGTIEKKGTKVTVVGSSGSWYRLSVKIKGKTQTGYIKKSSIKLMK